MKREKREKEIKIKKKFSYKQKQAFKLAWTFLNDKTKNLF